MKAIFYLPAHPSYFDGDFSQEQIDAALMWYDNVTGGLISKGNNDSQVKEEFVLLREPGKSVTVVFDSAGLSAGDELPEAVKELAFEQYRVTSNRSLATHIKNITNALKPTAPPETPPFRRY